MIFLSQMHHHLQINVPWTASQASSPQHYPLPCIKKLDPKQQLEPTVQNYTTINCADKLKDNN